MHPMQTVIEITDLRKLMDHRPPFSQLSIGSISIDAPARAESVSFVCEIRTILYLRQASSRHKLLPLAKGLGIPSRFQLSTPSTLNVFFLHYSYDVSFTYRINGSFFYSFLLSPSVSCVFSFQKPQESEPHQNQAYTQFARFWFDHQFGVHGIFAQLTASALNEAKIDFHPFAADATDNRLRFSHHSSVAATLSHHEAKQEVYLSDSLSSSYVNSDIKSSNFFTPVQTAYNKSDEELKLRLLNAIEKET